MTISGLKGHARRAWLRALPTIASAVMLPACLDPADDFDDFAARNRPAPTGSTGGSGPAPSGCTQPDPSQVAAEYLVTSVVVPLAPKQPALVRGTFVPTMVGDELHIEVTAVALSAIDRKTPVADPTPFGTLIVDKNGNLTTDSVDLSAPGAANAVICGADIEGAAAFEGTFCAPEGGGIVQFACGTFSGTATAPLKIPDLKGIFTLQAIEPGGPVPDPLVDCDRTPAIAPVCK